MDLRISAKDVQKDILWIRISYAYDLSLAYLDVFCLCDFLPLGSVSGIDSFRDILQKYRLIDTAGIRKKAAVASSGSTTEALSVNRAFRAIRRSDLVALVIEAMACITEQVCYITLPRLEGNYGL